MAGHTQSTKEEQILCDSLLSGWDWLIFYPCSKTTVRKQVQTAIHLIFFAAFFLPLKKVLFAKVTPPADQPHSLLRVLA